MHGFASSTEPIPTMEDGEQFPFALSDPTGETWVFADNLHDIVGVLAGSASGYMQMDDPDDEFIVRYNMALEFVSELSRFDIDPDSPGVYPIMDELIERGVDDDVLTWVAHVLAVNQADEPSERAAMFTGDSPLEGKPYGWFYLPPLDDERDWDYWFPYVGMATDYYPYTGTMPPSGAVALIDPTNEKTFMDSLSQTYALVAEMTDVVSPIGTFLVKQD